MKVSAGEGMVPLSFFPPESLHRFFLHYRPPGLELGHVLFTTQFSPVLASFRLKFFFSAAFRRDSLPL